MLRRSPLLLLLMAAACFSDAPPSGLSTSGSVSASATGTTAPGPDATGPDSTSTSTSTATSTTPVTTSATTTATTGALTTTSATTGELTTDDLTMGATVTSTSGPGTTDADPYATCGAAPTQSECFDCCRGEGDWEVFRGNLAGCVCPDAEHPCFAGCFDPLCNTDTLAEACFGCFEANDACVAEAVAQCVIFPDCAAFVGCLDGAACYDKP
ncbi:hypothetical protein [Nannocystis pusilla]|uniref:hypothetical protein n=1 Tax=Nannocystis pusilla TaxID=889268 RepID=UPI003BF3017D